MKYRLLAAVAAGALISSPAFAQHTPLPERDGTSTIEGDVYGSVEYYNEIDTSIETNVDFDKYVNLFGTVDLDGVVNVDSAAVAVNDVKQMQTDALITYREEPVREPAGDVSAVFGAGIPVGYFAPIINTVTTFDVTTDGNVGVNLAAGYYNEQLNSAVLAISDDLAGAEGGWAEASATAMQSLVGTYHGSSDFVIPEDEPAGNNFRDRNTIAGANLMGSGNLGVNAAAGALNQQGNLLTLAVANDSTMAEANAGLVQSAVGNLVEQQDSINFVTSPTVMVTGNVGVNFAAGVGNQQLNSLSIATSQAADAAGGPTLPGGDS